MSGHALSQVAPVVDPASLGRSLAERLVEYRQLLSQDPFANPIQCLALTLAQRLGSGELAMRHIDALVQDLSVEGFIDRAERLRRYLGEVEPARNDAILETLFRSLSVDADGVPLPFEAFRDRMEREAFGIVFTAHPTFALSGALMEDLATLAAGTTANGEPLCDAGRAAVIERVAAAEHRPDPELTLAREHALSLEAIGRTREALGRAVTVLLRVTRDLYPGHWTEISPRLLTVATWVGYDLDGRSDIGWTDTLHKRLLVQVAQLDHYLDRVRHLRADAADGAPEFGETLDLLESRLALAIAQIRDEIAAFSMADPATPRGRDLIRSISLRMHSGKAMRLASADGVIAIVARALARAQDDGLRERLCLLRAELATHGLGAAHTHVRINATQVHNAIRRTVGLVSDPNDPRYRQSYLSRINRLLDETKPVEINFGSVIVERTSVRRLFMLLTQLLKYNDRSTPIRFLIAETESAFTCLATLYYARLFGIDGRIDISPLFETERALEGGSRIVEQLLDNGHYRAYVQRRGRLCVQTGFSDAGRYLGQTPAAASIERLRLRLIRVMASAGLDGVQLLIFDTHGESIGRGAHPASFAERLSYVDTPASRSFIAERGVSFKQEVSFQGGDGYIYFAHPDLAYATVTRILEHALTRGPTDAVADPFYDEHAYVREFFTTVKAFQDRLMQDRDYGVLLSAFGANLLYSAGSRPSKRQYEDPSELDEAMPSQFRAIPHNAILMQLGLPANSVGGVGAAIAKDPDHFRDLYARSPRFRQLIGMVVYGASAAHPQAMRGYIDALDPGSWIVRAAHAGDRARADQMLALSAYIENRGVSDRQARIFRMLYKDFILLGEGLKSVEATAPAIEPKVQDAIALLHAVRLALIHEIFLLAMRIPEFSSRHRMTQRQVVGRILHLDIPAAVEALEEIFPLTEESISTEDFGEPETYRSDESQNYQFENEMIFRPMRELYDLLRRISSAIANRVGFFG
jgi:phosphoenolpyruvate carboxylase